MNTKRLAVLAVAILLAAGAAYLYFARQPASADGVIRVSGNIEVIEAEVSFKIPGRVVERHVSEGETVKAGQLVARLDDSELVREVALRKAEVQAAEAVLAELVAGSRPEEIAQAEAAARQAQARLDELLAGSRPEEVAAAQAAADRARADAVRWQSEFDRIRQLHEEGVVSAQLLDSVRANQEMSREQLRAAEQQWKLVQAGPRKEQIEQARAALQQASAQLSLVKAGPRREQIAQARARLEQSRQVLAAAETRLSYTVVVAPLSGIVLSKNIEPGEFVAAGTPVVTVGEMANVWLRAYINEPDLGRVKVGQAARVRTDTYPGKFYEGRVSFLSSQAEFTPRNVQTEQERVKLVYRVKIDLPNPQMELKPGMPADAEILTGSAPEAK
jgi:HlyD family secretion protein